ncbi:MAG: hypothetical protein KAI41_12345 [Hyphomicrobiaceae bacterium]|nr:hypothetical protein [Hyphomicrobiaceae bacterium]
MRRRYEISAGDRSALLLVILVVLGGSAAYHFATANWPFLAIDVVVAALVVRNMRPR